MVGRRCKCMHARLSGAAEENFYRRNFIPRKWRMLHFGPVTDGPTLYLNGYCKDCYQDLEVMLSVEKQDSRDAAFQAIYDAVSTLHPYDEEYRRSSGEIFYCGDCDERSSFYAWQHKMPLFQRNTQFLDLFSEYDREDARLWLEKKFPPQSHTEVYRDTGGSLFCSALRMAKENGDFDKVSEILDYVLPCEHEDGTTAHVKLTAYEFDFHAVADFGGSEGIYLDCYLRGKFDESGKYQLHVGSIKTLQRDLEAMKRMAELGGALTYYVDRYVNAHLHRYTPDRELEAEAKRRSES